MESVVDLMITNCIYWWRRWHN